MLKCHTTIHYYPMNKIDTSNETYQPSQYKIISNASNNVHTYRLITPSLLTKLVPDFVKEVNKESLSKIESELD